MTRVRLTIAFLLATPLAACSSPEDQVARTAEIMDNAKVGTVESVRAEGNRLIIRHKDVKTGGLTDSELTRMMTAGLCKTPMIADLIRDGAAVSIELPRNFDYLTIDIDRCSA